MSRIFAVVALLAIVLAGVFSIRLAMADAVFRRHTPEGVARALEMLPNQLSYILMRALQIEYDGGDSTVLLERAARMNSVSSAPRIRLGLAAETRGDFSGAEKWLLEAARVDRQFEPRWTLANFYFRRERRDEFWKWMRAALEISYGDRRPAFDLCWRTTQDAGEVLARAIPGQHDVLATYLSYVLEGRHEAVGPVALELAALRNPADVQLLEVACDLLLDSRKLVEARELWRELGHAPQGLIVNGDFATEPSGHGFDWRPAHPAGVTDIPVSGAHRFVLSGRQPESCELLLQFVALEPDKRYSLHWEARTQGFGLPTGIEWTAGAARGMVESADDWRAGGVEFRGSGALVPITLRYRRPTGQARADGWVEIRKVSLVEMRR